MGHDPTATISSRHSVQGALTNEALEPYCVLLRDRFQLKVRRERKCSQVYSLVLAKNGPKANCHAGAGESRSAAATDGKDQQERHQRTGETRQLP